MNKGFERSKAWLWFTVPIAALLAIASGGGAFVSSVYRDAPYFKAQAVGQDIVSFVVVLPLMILTALLAGRGSTRAHLVWLGGLVYLVYSYAIAAFDVRFNPLFLVYVALLGCSLYALVGSLSALDRAVVKASFSNKTPTKAVGIYFAVLAVLFYLLWLRETVPALAAGETPQSVLDNGTPTNAVHVLDMAWILPAFVTTAVSLWRKRALGYVLAGALLSYIVLLVSAILSMVLFMVRAGQPTVVLQAAIFAALLATSLGALVWFLSGLKSQPVSASRTA